VLIVAPMSVNTACLGEVATAFHTTAGSSAVSGELSTKGLAESQGLANSLVGQAKQET